MYVSRVTPFLADLGSGKNLCFVKVETDGGPHGWGECYTQADRDTSIVALVEAIGRYLVGRDAAHITHFVHWAYHDFAAKRGAMDFWSAVSGLEQALWDIAGKRHGVPVHELLGGPCRDRVRVYANGWYGGAKTPVEYAARARDTVVRGFNALKLDPFPGPWRTHITRAAEEQAVANVAAVREAVGAEVDLLIEVHRRLAPMHAVRVAREMERFRPFWYEEPVSSTNLEALAECRRQIAIPIVTGEELYTRADFRRVFELRAADIVNPDVCNCGGILELTEIAAWAEPHLVGVTPHNWNSLAVGLAATLQASACIRDLVTVEHISAWEDRSAELLVDPAPLAVTDGSIAIPTGPGIGVDLDERALARHPMREYTRLWPD